MAYAVYALHAAPASHLEDEVLYCRVQNHTAAPVDEKLLEYLYMGRQMGKRNCKTCTWTQLKCTITRTQ